MDYVKKCPICGSSPVINSGTIKGYEPDVSITIKCDNCKYPKRGSADTVYSADYNKAYNKAVGEWNDEVDKIEEYLSHRK